MADSRFAADAKPSGDLLDAAGADAHHLMPTTNKRKRPSGNDSAVRPAPGQRSAGSLSNADDTQSSFLHSEDDMNHYSGTDLSAIAQHNNQNGRNGSLAGDTAAAALSAHYSMTVPQATELSFQPLGPGADNSQSFATGEHQDYGLDALKDNQQAATQSSPTTSTNKPAVGSDEWHKQRRDNHKEVERRRRETINEGINELAKIVPGCEKNKGSILQRAVQFITQLKENEQQNIEKWTLEKLLTEQAIAELSASCEKFKADAQQSWQEVEVWKAAAQRAGVTETDLNRNADREPNSD